MSKKHAPPRHLSPPNQNIPIKTMVGINLEQRKVILEYDRHLNNLAYTPAEAVLTARHLLMAAMHIDTEAVAGWTWPQDTNVAANG